MGVGHTRSDRATILAGTSQNVVGLALAGVATLAVNVLVGRRLGSAGFGVVTVVSQAAFVVSFATRAGMDMAVLRHVAIEAGELRWHRIRLPVARAVQVAAGVSVAAAAIVFAFAGRIAGAVSFAGTGAERAVRAAAVGLPFLAVTNVWLAATRGLKIMRHTLYVFWAGQPVVWIVLMVGGWSWAETAWVAVAAYSGSWAAASVASYVLWRKETRAWPRGGIEPDGLARLVRYAAPRAPAALFSQLLFWTDLFVLARYAPTAEVGVYSAALRTGQILVLFLTSVNLMFSPYVADLHNRDERERLDGLFKSLTRWTLAATLPIGLLLAIAPGTVLQLFGGGFGEADAALRILVAGQMFNIATGSVGFILIMVGRTGWDLIVYAASVALDVGVALALTPHLGMEGAAIANAVTFALSNAVRLALVVRFVGIQPYDRHYLRLIPVGLAAAAVMALVHAGVQGRWLVDLTATGVLGTFTFAAAYLWFAATPEERQGLARLRSPAGRR